MYYFLYYKPLEITIFATYHLYNWEHKYRIYFYHFLILECCKEYLECTTTFYLGTSFFLYKNDFNTFNLFLASYNALQKVLMFLINFVL